LAAEELIVVPKEKNNLRKSGKSLIAAKKSTAQQKSLKAMGRTSQNGAPEHCPEETGSGKGTILVNTSRQLSPIQMLPYSSQWDGGENWKGKSEKTCGLR